jgi:hypothetical protein
MAVPGDGEFVLSELHLAQPAGAGSTRFHYREDAPAAPPSPPSGSGSERSSDSSDERGRRARRAAKRRGAARPRPRFVTIRHEAATPLARCGAQVWRGACLLADAALDAAGAAEKGGPPRLAWRALELGAGAGLLAALSAARLRCPLFVATDAEPSALALAAANVAAARAGGGMPPGSSGGGGAIELVRHLSWFSFLGVDPAQLTDEELLALLNGGGPAPPGASSASAGGAGTAAPTAADAVAAAAAAPGPGPCFAWGPADLQLLESVDTFLAGDCIYDPPLTEAFVHAAACLMRWVSARQRQRRRGGGGGSGSSGGGTAAGRGDGGEAQGPSPPAPRLLLAAEKRFNFTFHDTEAPRAAAWEHFLTYVADEGGSGSGGERRQRPLLRGRRLELPKQVRPRGSPGEASAGCARGRRTGRAPRFVLLSRTPPPLSRGPPPPPSAPANGIRPDARPRAVGAGGSRVG